jgi:hypothetical protein
MNGIQTKKKRLKTHRRVEIGMQKNLIFATAQSVFGHARQFWGTNKFVYILQKNIISLKNTLRKR